MRQPQIVNNEVIIFFSPLPQIYLRLAQWVFIFHSPVSPIWVINRHLQWCHPSFTPSNLNLYTIHTDRRFQVIYLLNCFTFLVLRAMKLLVFNGIPNMGILYHSLVKHNYSIKCCLYHKMFFNKCFVINNHKNILF